MTDQMTYRQKIRNEKEEIDLVQMIQYVLQKWKILLLAGVVGLLLGGAFGAMKTGKEPAQMDINDLNADQIQQYANYHQFYEDEVARQKESIYMNMDPGAVYMADKSYYVAAQESDLNRLGLAISSILQKQEVYDRIWAETGLTCSQSSLSELMSVTFAETEKNAIQLSDDRSSDGRVNISVAAPSVEIGEKILAVLDAQVQAVCAQVAQTAEGGMTYEAMTQSGRTGYCEDVVTARQNGEKRLATYQETLGKIEAKLTDNDKAYYAQVYEGSWKPENKMPKWAALGGADADYAMRCLGVYDVARLPEALLRAGMGSRAELFVAQMQDVLGLGAESRMNTPGTAGGNWVWRLLPGQADAQAAARLLARTQAACRA